MKRSPSAHGRRKTASCKTPLSLTLTETQKAICRGARAILEAYWEKLGGKPVPADAKPASKKRGRQSAGGSGTPDSTAIKKQKKSVGRKSKDGGASISNFQEEDTTPDVPYGFTEVGADNWKVPKIANGAWDQAVHAVDTIEKDDQGELWAYLVWNDQNEDGRYYRSKAKLATCNKCCPQRVCFFSPSMGSNPQEESETHANFPPSIDRCFNSTRSTCKFPYKVQHSPPDFLDKPMLTIPPSTPQRLHKQSQHIHRQQRRHHVKPPPPPILLWRKIFHSITVPAALISNPPFIIFLESQGPSCCCFFTKNFLLGWSIGRFGN